MLIGIGVVVGVILEFALWKYCDWFIKLKDLEDEADS